MVSTSHDIGYMHYSLGFASSTGNYRTYLSLFDCLRLLQTIYNGRDLSGWSRVQLPGREPSRFPRFPFLVPTQKRETDRETPETGRKRRKPPGFPFPDFTGELLPDGKLNPDAGSQNSIGQHNRSALGAASVAARSRIRVSGPIAAGARRQGAGAGDTSARALAASFGGGDLVGSSHWEGEAGADAAARAT